MARRRYPWGCDPANVCWVTTQTLRVSEPRDVLAMVPFQLGFTPSDSLVAISVRGSRNRVGLMLRADLPGPDPGEVDQLCRQVVGHLTADGAAGALLVVYSEHQDALGSPEVARVLQGVRAELAGSGIAVHDAWHVGATRYRSLLCERECCPPEGFEVADLQSSVVGAEMAWRGVAVAQNRTQLLGNLTSMGDERRAQVERLAVRQEGRRGRGGGWPGTCWGETVLAEWRVQVARAVAAGPEQPDGGQHGAELQDAGDVPASAAGLLLAGLADVVVRDAVMLTCVPDSGREPERFAARGGSSPAAEALFDSVFGPVGARRPDAGTVTAASQVLRSLVRQATGRRAAPPLALLAWLAWWSGEGGRAGDYLERAVDSDPGLSLVHLLLESLQRGVAPGWVCRDRAVDLQGSDRG